MPYIPQEALPYFEKKIYLPMVLTVLAQDRKAVENGPFKLKRPYVNMINRAIKLVQLELRETLIYLKRHNMKVLRQETDEMFTEYVFFHGGYEEPRRYLNVRLRNRTEELLSIYFAKTEHLLKD